MRSPYNFPESSDGPTAIILTDIAGNYNSTGKPTQVTDAPSFFKLTATGAGDLTFFVDCDGLKHYRIASISVKASASVTVALSLQMFVNGTWGIVTDYTTSLSGADALANVTKKILNFDDIPPGTKVKIVATVGGATDVAICVMGRYY